MKLVYQANVPLIQMDRVLHNKVEFSMLSHLFLLFKVYIAIEIYF